MVRRAYVVAYILARGGDRCKRSELSQMCWNLLFSIFVQLQRNTWWSLHMLSELEGCRCKVQSPY